ncbi:MAG: hypothetical protein GY820_24585 [Gammaproteobacteria bacterium]|nr:hypothetical protein [Gammaproteobacteria bacterium]
MENFYRDISKYYAANIYDNLLIVGRIILHEDRYSFSRDDIQGPFNLVSNPDADVTRMVQVIGEIHPLIALEGILDANVSSCLYLNENTDSGEIEVRSIHKGMGTSIYSKQECPLILWNPNYDKHGCFDVIDIQNVFNDERLKNSFISVISESLRELELFPPLIHLGVDQLANKKRVK